MGWRLEGVTMEVCTCPTLCLCNVGAADLPSGHSGACVWDIRQGESNGIDLAGTMAAMAYDMPGDFSSGDGRARVYLGDSATPEQHRELDAIFTGQRGGVFAFFEFSTMLAVRSVTISLVEGERPTATVGDVARVTLRRYMTASGKQTTLNDAEYQEPFGVTREDLCDASGSRWADPELRDWNAGAGGIATFALEQDSAAG